MTDQSTTLSAIDLRAMIDTHVDRGAPMLALETLTPDELLDIFVIASQAYDNFDGLVDDLAQRGSPLVVKYRPRLERATKLRRRARDLLIPLLNLPPR